MAHGASKTGLTSPATVPVTDYILLTGWKLRLSGQRCKASGTSTRYEAIAR